MSKHCFRNLLHAAMIFLILLVASCGKDQRPPADKAEKSVELFLDAWSRGEPPDKFANPDGAIQGSDPDWKAGYRLLSFLSSESKQSPEAPDHIRCRVALTLQDKRGQTADRQVIYDVQLGEKAVIGRVSP